MGDALTRNELTPEQVAAFLRRHPDFLNDYPELATELTLPSAQGGAASLSVYQLQGLRDKNAALEARLVDLIAVAAENEALMTRVHELTVAMLRANTPAVAARSVVARLGSHFHCKQVRLVLFGAIDMPPADWLLAVPDGRAALPEFAGLLAHHEPMAGRLSGERLQRLFGDQASMVKSAAVLPLGELGLLALGSAEADRFQPGMGTVFLKMIATALTAALQRARDLA